MGSYAEVALPLSIDRTFTYAVPDDMAGKVVLGCQVLVPFRERKIAGFVVGLAEKPEREDIREILELVNRDPCFNEHLLSLTKWVSKYYLCSWGQALKAALPRGLGKREERTVRAREGMASPVRESLSPLEERVLRVVLQSGEASWSEIRKRVGTGIVGPALRRLERRGLVEIASTVKEPSTKPRTEEVFSLKTTLSRRQIDSIRCKAPKQAEVLDYLRGAKRVVTRSELKRALAVSHSTLSALVKQELIQPSRKEIFRSPFRDLPSEEKEEPRLTGEQAVVFRQIRESLRARSFRSFLLYGITASGKTEIYIRAIRETISISKRAIVLVPEISLTPQILSTLRARFGQAVGVLHSRLSQGERFDVWRRAKEGEYRVVVGARSAVFAPLDDLGLIIVDEEHETSYKQDEPDPRYSGRDVALIRAKLAGAVCILGSATPSLESFRNAEEGKSTLVCLSRRMEGRGLPPVTIVDMKASQHEVFSPALLEKIEERLLRGEQTILFLNRRGFSSFLFCRDCGLVFKCGDCSVSLTHHRSENALLCHYCGYRTTLPDECPNCGGRRVTSRGVGTERVEKELESFFPAVRVARMDLDTTSRKGAHQKIFYSFKKGEADILLGTQMVAKGFDFPRVTLVGVISADTALNIPDFRSAERTFQLLTQVAGRTGRGDLGGEVVVQTYSPDHYAIQLARVHDYLGFYSREIEERRELNYPPFSRLVRIVMSSPVEEEARKESLRFASKLRDGAGRVDILGPAPAPIPKVRRHHRWQILIKGKDSSAIQRALQPVLSERRREGVRITVTVDPVDMM